MSDESRGDGQPSHLERTGMPPPIDFGRIAQSAISGGLFTRDVEAERLNGENSSSGYKLPTSMLELPYPNGPMVIEHWGEDIPEAVMNKVRKNWVTANRLLLPNDQVLPYFHQRFIAQDVLQSLSVQQIVSDFSPAFLTSFFSGESDFKDPALSFQVEGVNRTTRDRHLFTKEEQQAGIELIADQPEVALTILSYQGVVQDYLQTLGSEFQRIAQAPNDTVSDTDLERYKHFVEQWDTPNFTRELVPAIALYHTLAKQAHPESPADQLLTQQLFQDAVDFVIANGAFRNNVTVPASVASDHEERVNKFLCPAVGTIRDQLLDGALLNKIYGLTKAQTAAGNQPATAQAETLRLKAQKRLDEPRQAELRKQQEALEEASPTIVIETEGKTLEQVIKEAVPKALGKKKPATFSFEGKDYEISYENLQTTFRAEEEQIQPGDETYYSLAGQYFSDALNQTITQALLTKKPVCFEFNGKSHRIIPDTAYELLKEKGSES